MGGNKLGLIVGAIACVIGICALVLGAYAVHNITSTSGSITTGAVRSSTVTVNDQPVASSSSSVVVLQSGTYNITTQYFVATQPGVPQMDSRVAGTFTLRSINVNDVVAMMYLELTPFTYTFNAVPSAQGATFSLRTFNPTFSFAALQNIYACSPYTVTTSTSGTTTSINTVSFAVVPEFAVVFFPGPAMNIASGFQLTLNAPIRVVFGTLVL